MKCILTPPTTFINILIGTVVNNVRDMFDLAQEDFSAMQSLLSRWMLCSYRSPYTTNPRGLQGPIGACCCLISDYTQRSLFNASVVS